MRAYLGLGANLGDPRASMAQALSLLDVAPGVAVSAVSRLYRTPPWGKLDQPVFINACAAIETDLPPIALLDLCLAIEQQLKRERRERWGPRTIDIDLLAMEGVDMAHARLVLPHPRLHERGFVVRPLADIAPQLAVAGRRIADWLSVADLTGIEPVSADGRWWLGFE